MHRWLGMRPGRRTGLTAAIIVVVALVLGGPAFGDPHDDKNRVDRKLAKARSTLEAATDRARDAAAAYTEANRKLPGARNKLAEAKGEVAAAEVAAERARRDAAKARKAVGTAKLAYRKTERRVSAARDKLSKFVAAAYKGSGFMSFNAMLDAKSPSDLADRMAFIEKLAADKQAALDNVVKLRHEAKLKQNDAVLAQRKADEAKRAAEDALAAAVDARDAAAKAATDVNNLVKTRKNALDVADEERDKTLARYRELQRESRRIQDEIRAMANKDRASGGHRASNRARSGYFIMPTSGWKSSDFGYRWDPYYRVWQLHAGVDIAAPRGQSIHAGDSGRVFRAGWNGGYGNYTCIYHGLYHGRGLATCYAHQSAILVSDGQWVRRGQAIGRVGTTGASTGNHLHFEVRLNGTPVNPVPWLPSCFC
jgi:murein DD-endopeptidase MepM/ murein hydrolase activator NlpD